MLRLNSGNKGSGDNCADCDEVVQKARRKSLAARKGSDLPPDSAKTRKVMDLLAEIDERSQGDDKTIIFSQFTSMLDLLEPFLKDAGVRYVRCTCFHGASRKFR